MGRRRMMTATAIVLGLVLLWILFPPALHRRLRMIRDMQRAEESHMRDFLAEARAHPQPEPDINASIQDLESQIRNGLRGPLAGMPLRFDVNRYFEAFDRLRMDDGYVMDYVYCSTRQHGYPLLYARAKTNAPLPDVEAFEERFGRTTDGQSVNGAWIDRIRTDGSRGGFIQLAALRLVRDQFYLYWHANYNDTKILSRIPASVTYSKDTVSVALFVFSKWSGVARYVVSFKRSFPHEIVGERATVMVPYNCRVVY